MLRVALFLLISVYSSYCARKFVQLTEGYRGRLWCHPDDDGHQLWNTPHDDCPEDKEQWWKTCKRKPLEGMRYDADGMVIDKVEKKHAGNYSCFDQVNKVDWQYNVIVINSKKVKTGTPELECKPYPDCKPRVYIDFITWKKIEDRLAEKPLPSSKSVLKIDGGAQKGEVYLCKVWCGGNSAYLAFEIIDA